MFGKRKKNINDLCFKLEVQINPITPECNALFMSVTVELVLMKANLMLSLKGLLFCVPLSVIQLQQRPTLMFSESVNGSRVE